MVWRGNAEAKIKRLEDNPPIQQSGNDIRIGHIDDPELRHNISISYEVTVPAENRGSGGDRIRQSNSRRSSRPARCQRRLRRFENFGDRRSRPRGNWIGGYRDRPGEGQRTHQDWQRINPCGRSLRAVLKQIAASGHITLHQTAPGFRTCGHRLRRHGPARSARLARC